MTRSARVVALTLAGCIGMLVTLGVVLVRFGGVVDSGAAAEVVLQPAPSVGSRPVVRGRTTVDPAWIARVSPAAGIPTAALRAYAEAELRLQAEQPGCHPGWNTLAGIGWIESHHGTIGDRVLGDDGRSSSPILGPALNGSGDVAAIRSTPTSTAWHGDPTWDHAVGPLQFLSSTWDRWGADGDGDGSADPRDLDDAALAAGRYLCADGHDLATDAGWYAAVHSYNHDDGYVAAVSAAASAYAARTGGSR